MDGQLPEGIIQFECVCEVFRTLNLGRTRGEHLFRYAISLKERYYREQVLFCSCQDTQGHVPSNRTT